MTEEFTTAQELIRQLDAKFPGTQSLIVGGAVRDFLLNVQSHDVDIATNVPFEELVVHFNIADITKNTVNAQPVSIITYKGFLFEIAAFRSDSSGVEGRANNISTVVSTFEEDSARRDITINAMGINSEGFVIDPQNGRADLRLGIIRAVGNPHVRFAEDATRILRVFRFAAKFNFMVASETLDAAESNRNRLLDRDQISPESIAKELYKAASCGPQLARFLGHLHIVGILEMILPEFTVFCYGDFRHDPKHHPEGGGTVDGHIIECLNQSRSSDPVTNLAILFHDLGKAVTRGDKPNGYHNFHGHEDAGVPITEAIFERLRFNDLTADDKAAILFSVERHMLIHKLEELNVGTLSRLVLSPHWAVIKDVGYADDASRHVDEHGNNIFDSTDFNARIEWAEERVHKIAANDDSLRLKVKEWIDGNIVKEWFPDATAQNIKVLKPILAGCAEWILEQLDEGQEITQDKVRLKAYEILLTQGEH